MFWKWTKRIVLGLLLIILLIIAVQYFSFRSGLKQVIDDLPGSSQIIETASGPVEYQIQGNSDKYVLLLHGTPGSYRTFMANVLVENGFSVISPSRPGYFRTPVESGQSIDDQALMLKNLLESLEIDSVAVIGFSGGGPYATQFAINHPEKCTHLVVIAGVVQKVPPPESNLMSSIMSTDFGSWVMMGLMTSQFEDEEIAEIALNYVRSTVLPLSETEAGQNNDREIFTTLPEFELDRIQAPSLIIHGTDDEIIPFSQAEYLHERISNSTLIAEDGKDHFTVVFFEFDRVLQQSADFIKK